MGSADRFLEAWEKRDIGVMADALAPEAVLHSPVVTTSFRGRDAVLELFDVLLETFGEIEFTNRFEGDGDAAFYWFAELRGRRIRGTDMLRFDANGKVVEITVFIRPLVGIGWFVAIVGSRLARRRGPVHGALVRLLAAPLRLVLAINDRLAPLLAMRR